jgi:hypothetical protein
VCVLEGECIAWGCVLASVSMQLHENEGVHGRMEGVHGVASLRARKRVHGLHGACAWGSVVAIVSIPHDHTHKVICVAKKKRQVRRQM